ncbi:MAG: hypothetical protein ACKVQR_11555, partial [Aquabacterium sp.]
RVPSPAPSADWRTDPIERIEDALQELKTSRSARPEVARLKLLIDARLARGFHRSAGRLLAGAFAARGIEPAALEAASGRFLRDLDATGDAPAAPRQVLDEALLAIRDEILRGRDAADAQAAADLLNRYAELRAGRAAAAGGGRSALPARVLVYSAYFVADRVRSDSARAMGAVGWPMASARPMRYYIRACLEMARLLAGHSSGDRARATRVAIAFFDHARERLDVYARHLFRLPRERLSMLLLLAEAARVWAKIGVDASDWPAEFDSPMISLDYLERAEHLLFELGLPPIPARRFCYERVQTLECIIAASADDTGSLRALIERDRAALLGMAAGSPFWEGVVARMQAP